MPKTTVLYIAGWGRSGTTILGNILGQLPGFFHAGELGHLWQRDIVEDAMCGCGVRFSACPVWGRILRDTFGGIDAALARRMIELRTRMPTHRDVFLHTLRPHASTLNGGPAQSEYVQTLARLYSGVLDHGRNRVIVDSTKIPAYLYMLGQVPNLDVRVIHMVRDPRATTFSWLRRIERTDAGRTLTMEQFPAWESAGRWVTWNAVVPIVAKLIRAPVKRILYESFVANPRETLREVLSVVDDVCPVSESLWPFAGPNEVELQKTHTVWGNPSRQRAGRVKISLDTEWLTSLGAWRKTVVLGLTYPLARYYGYFSSRELKKAIVSPHRRPPPRPSVTNSSRPPPSP
jgi:sulfotransferase family protein